MAERRMFAINLIGSDDFLDLPHSAQCLYFHLALSADDDGFVNSPKSVMRKTGTCDNDFDLLKKHGFLLTFEDGPVVIRHWKMHNKIRKDRYRATAYQKELGCLMADSCGTYFLGKPKVATGEDREGKDREGKDNVSPKGDNTAFGKYKRRSSKFCNYTDTNTIDYEAYNQQVLDNLMN